MLPDDLQFMRTVYRTFLFRHLTTRQLRTLSLCICVGPATRDLGLGPDVYGGALRVVPAGGVLLDILDREGPTMTLLSDDTGARFVWCLPMDRDMVTSVQYTNDDPRQRARLTRLIRTYLRQHDLLPTAERRTA